MGISGSNVFSEQFDNVSAQLHVVLRDTDEQAFDTHRDGDPDIPEHSTGLNDA
jgi:nitrogen fixation-related uncharacterized protein